MSTSPSPINLFDFEAIAKERLPKAEYDYIAGGATDEISVERNRRAYESWALRRRVLRDVSALDLSTTVSGTRVSLPVLIAPCGGHKRAHPDGELATYRAAAACGTILAVSANSTTSFEELAKATRGHLWLQLYPFGEREMTKEWLMRAKEAGYDAVCVTLDSQWPPKRERNIRNNYRRSRGVNYPKDGAQTPRPAGRAGEGSDPAATWKDLEWIKSAADLPIVAKGIMTGEDVELCADAGADAVIVANQVIRRASLRSSRLLKKLPFVLQRLATRRPQWPGDRRVIYIPATRRENHARRSKTASGNSTAPGLCLCRSPDRDRSNECLDGRWLPG